MQFHPGRDQLTAIMSRTNPTQQLGQLAELRPNAKLPVIDRRWCISLWGDDKKTQRIKTWGHQDDKLSAHFLIVRGGTPLHTDPGYARYTLHIELFNGGWTTHGLEWDPQTHPILQPGFVSVLDTWSPHKVSLDKRLEYTSPSKVAAALDFVEQPTPAELDEGLDKLVAWLPTIDLP